MTLLPLNPVPHTGPHADSYSLRNRSVGEELDVVKDLARRAAGWYYPALMIAPIRVGRRHGTRNARLFP